MSRCVVNRAHRLALLAGVALACGGVSLRATPAAAQADLSVSVTDGLTEVEPGRNVTFSVIVRNEGPADAIGAQLRGSLDPVLDATVFWLCSGAASDPVLPASAVPDVGTDNLTATVNLPSGGVLSCVVSVGFLRTTLTRLRYTASLKAPTGVPDPDPSDNQASDETLVRAAADLQVAVRGLPSAPSSGQVLTFFVSVRNTGPSTATGVRLDVDKPSTAYIDQPPTGPGWRCDDRGSSFRCVLAELPVNTLSELWLSLLPSPDAARLSIGATAASEVVELQPSDNQATAELPITWQPGKARAVTLSGGGFGCQISGSFGAHAISRGALCFEPVLFLATLVGLARRRRRQKQQRGLLCDEFY